MKGCNDVYASFDKYVEVERLEGDNKYQANEHGLQVSERLLFGFSRSMYNILLLFQWGIWYLSLKCV